MTLFQFVGAFWIVLCICVVVSPNYQRPVRQFHE